MKGFDATEDLDFTTVVDPANPSDSDLPRRLLLRASWSEGQEWFALGTPVRQLLVNFDGWPAPVAAPDPRYFALHKLWLSQRPSRIRQGRAPKDAAQGKMLLKAIQEHMRHYPIDGEFVRSLPDALRRIWEA